MKKNHPVISEQDSKRQNRLSDQNFYKPTPLYPEPPTPLYILSYVATRELEKIKMKFMDIGQTKPSPF